jgi:hypothetical protein
MKKAIPFINILLLAALFSSCEPSQKNTDAILDPIAVDSTDTLKSEKAKEYISIPAPDEMFLFIKTIGTENKSASYLNSPDNYKNYNSIKAKALNFGIYAADFLYCATFISGSEAFTYFGTMKQLADDLGISEVINPSYADRIKKNIGNNDSLREISNALYFSTISVLEHSNRASSLALVMTAGWIESMNLIIHTVKKYNADDPTIQHIAEQKITVTSLMGYLHKYKDDANTAAIMAQINELKELYDQLHEESVSNTVIEKNGKKIISSGTKMIITEKQYQAIQEKVKEIRENFISGK